MRENLAAGENAKDAINTSRLSEFLCVTNYPFYLEIAVSDPGWGRVEHAEDWAVDASPAPLFPGHPIAREPIGTALGRTTEPCRY
jgi:hypothetical protein